jgi:hypothetical protein
MSRPGFPSRDRTTQEFRRLWADAERAQERNLTQCLKMLRAGYGIAAMHPDDGWVNREKNTIVFCYPRYRGEVMVGSMVALGHEEISTPGVIGRYRIVEVVSVSTPGLFSADRTYTFVERVPVFEVIPPEGWDA